MPWLAATFEIDARGAEPLADALLEAGAIAADVSDAAAGTPDEKPVYGEPGIAPGSGWERSRVRALFPAQTDLRAAFSGAFAAAGWAAATPCSVEHVDDQDWVRATQSQFAPIRISSRLWIVPSWHAAPDRAAINIVLDPGLAFGTGAHPTTRLALRWLEPRVRGGEVVIDYGCGSGVLAIAALKLGAASAYGVDIDEQALLAARHNAMQNQVSARFFAAADKLGQPPQIVVANILANPLVVLAPLLAKQTARGGRVAPSGILAEQAEDVRAAYLERFDMDTIEHEEGWVLMSGVQK